MTAVFAGRFVEQKDLGLAVEAMRAVDGLTEGRAHRGVALSVDVDPQ